MNLSRMAGFFLLAAASPAHDLEIKLSLGHAFPKCPLSTSHAGRPATGIKALLYATGCGIQTLDLPVSDFE